MSRQCRRRHDAGFVAKGLDVSETPRDLPLCAGCWARRVARCDPGRGSRKIPGHGRSVHPVLRGAPLLTEDGSLGSLCVIDRVPSLGRRCRRWQVVGAMGEDTNAAGEAGEAGAGNEQKFRILADAAMVWSTLPDGHHDYYNARWYEFTGVPEGRPTARAGTVPRRSGEGWERWGIRDRRRDRISRGMPRAITALGRLCRFVMPMAESRWWNVHRYHERTADGAARDDQPRADHRIKNIFSGGLAASCGYVARQGA